MHDEFSQLPPDERRPLKRTPEVEEEGVEVPYDLLQAETLSQLIEAFVLKEGTDYGVEEVSLSRKVDQVRRQLEKGDLKIVFDLSTETGSIVRRK